jgi:rfaE bifunctional protein kinase chain/domain
MELLQAEYVSLRQSGIRKPVDYPRRNGFQIADLKDALEKFRGLKVVVIGDVMVDEYINCDPLGMSREDPTLVITPVESKRFVGGAGIVAAHARGLGASVKFISVAGRDEQAKFARRELQGHGVDAEILTDLTRPTTLKQRFRAWGKTLLRVNHLRQLSIAPALQDQLAATAEAALDGADVLLFADFNYGCLPQPLVDRLVAFAQARGVMMAADSQASSQMSDISRFKGMSIISPTEHEARLALHESEAGLVVVAERLQRAAQAENVVITLASEGLLIHAPKNGAFHTDRLPAFNSSPKDVAGAGDSFFVCAALALRGGVDIWQAAYLGAVAAACQVSRIGNTPLTAAELLDEIGNRRAS